MFLAEVALYHAVALASDLAVLIVAVGVHGGVGGAVDVDVAVSVAVVPLLLGQQ